MSGQVAALVALVAVVLIMLAVRSAAAFETTVPRTLVTFRGEAIALAQEGPRIAWDRADGSREDVLVFDTAQNRRWSIPVTRRDPDPLLGFAFDGRAVLLAVLGAPCGLSECDLAMRTGSIGDRSLRRVWSNRCDPSDPRPVAPACASWPVAGDKGTLAYVAYGTGGGVRVIRGRRTSRVTGLNYFTALEANGTRIAAGDATSIMIIDLRTGKRIIRFNTGAHLEAFALAKNDLVALVSTGGARQVEVHDPVTGARRDTFSVPPGTESEISISGKNVILRERRTIRLLNAVTGQVSVLATAGSLPVGLSIERNRVAWAETVGSRGRIRVINLGSR